MWLRLPEGIAIFLVYTTRDIPLSSQKSFLSNKIALIFPNPKDMMNLGNQFHYPKKTLMGSYYPIPLLTLHPNYPARRAPRSIAKLTKNLYESMIKMGDVTLVDG